MFARVLPTVAAAGAGLALLLIGSSAGAASLHQTRPAPVAAMPHTSGLRPAAVAKAGKTTLGAGYISKPGADYYSYSQFTIPTHCSKDGYAFLGTVGFTTAKAYNAQALVAYGCSHGMATAALQAYDVRNNQINTAAAAPGDRVQTYVYESNSETDVYAYDETTGAEAYIDDGPQAEIDNQFLTGNLEVPFYSLAGFGTVTFSDTVLDGAYINTHTTSAVTEMLNGVTQAKPGSLNTHHETFTVAWKHQ